MTIEHEVEQATSPRVDGPPSSARDVMTVLADAMVATMLDLGARTGLSRTLADGRWRADDLARAVAGDPRMTLEWLRSLTAAGLVEHDGDTYAWSGAAASMLAAPPGSPADMSAGVELYGALAASVPAVARAFAAGGALDGADYPEELGQAMEHMSQGWTGTVLPDLWLPQIPGLVDALTAGGTVAEIGCGRAGALAAIADRHPAARLVGFELDRRAAADARERLAGRGLAPRVTVRDEDAVDGLAGPYDLVLALSVLHDVVDLAALLGAIAGSLADTGHLLVVESPPLDGDPAAMLFATSTLFCVPSTAARGGRPRGTLGLPPDVLAAAAAEAGLEPCVTPPAVMPMVTVSVFHRRRR